MTPPKLLILAACAALPALSGCASVRTYPLFPVEATAEPSLAYAVARGLADGAEVPRDYEGAATIYAEAAQAGDAEAMNGLGIMALRDRGNAASLPEATSWFTKAAESGSAAARYNLGLAIEADSGGRFSWWGNDPSAVEQYRIAADQGHALAQRRLSVLLDRGQGVVPDPAEARRLRELAYAHGDRDELDRAASMDGMGDRLAAAAKLADDRCVGCGGLGEAARPVDHSALRQLAAAGDAPARYDLGVLLLKGSGVTRDPAGAARLFRLAAGDGYAPAQRQLGLMHLRGEVVTPSDVMAHAWLNLAARDEGKEGRTARAEMTAIEARMSPSDILAAQAKAAELAASS